MEPVSETKPEKSLWTRKIEAEPEHSQWFLQRFRTMRAEGKDIAGEARFVDALVPRQARIFDAGCGSGRTGGPLSELGHTVLGVDVDATLIDAAREDFPAATWVAGDLAELESGALRAQLGVDEPAGSFDAVVAAGNVMPFLAPSTRQTVLSALRRLLKPGGRFALGFGAGRGYSFGDFFGDVADTGWHVDATFRGWNLLPFTPGSEFLVALLSPAAAAPAADAGAVPWWVYAQASASAGASAGAPAGASAGASEVGPANKSADPMGGNSLRPLGS